MGAPNPDVTALVNQLALQHWTVANTPDLTGVIAAVNQQLSRLGGEINDPVIAFANAQLDALFALQEATEPAHGSASQTIGPGPAVPGALLTVSANSSPIPAPVGGTIVEIAGANGSFPAVVLDGFGGTTILDFRRAQGTAANPTAIGAQILGIIGWSGFGTTGYGARRAQLFAIATQTWTDSAQGVALSFNVTADNTIAPVEKMRLRGDGALIFPAGNSTGTPGNATINLATGRSAIAAGAATVTITNSLVVATSLVFAILQTNDATAILKNVVPGAGSFVVNLTAAATANTNFGWWTIN